MEFDKNEKEDKGQEQEKFMGVEPQDDFLYELEQEIERKFSGGPKKPLPTKSLTELLTEKDPLSEKD